MAWRCCSTTRTGRRGRKARSRGGWCRRSPRVPLLRPPAPPPPPPTGRHPHPPTRVATWAALAGEGEGRSGFRPVNARPAPAVRADGGWLSLLGTDDRWLAWALPEPLEE